MKICIPVARNMGLESQVYNHFGSAGCFLLVESGTLGFEAQSNENQHHQHGRCGALDALSGSRADAVVVGEIGQRARERFLSAGIDVYQSHGGTALDAVRHWKEGRLAPLGLQDSYPGHH